MGYYTTVKICECHVTIWMELIGMKLCQKRHTKEHMLCGSIGIMFKTK